jgi:hypothetical protein
MISVKNLETLLQLAVSCREYPACAVRPEDLEDMARELLEYRAKRTEELSQLEEQVRQLREALDHTSTLLHVGFIEHAIDTVDEALASTEPKEKA